MKRWIMPAAAIVLASGVLVGAGVLGAGAGIECDSRGIGDWSPIIGRGYETPSQVLIEFRRFAFPHALENKAALESALDADESAADRVVFEDMKADGLMAMIYDDGQLAARVHLISFDGLWNIDWSEECAAHV